MHPAIHLGEERFHAFIQSAISSGFQRICVTEHMTLSCSAAKDRIPAGKVGEYCKTVRRLAKAYEEQIEVLVGIEVDYHPDYISEIEGVLNAGDFDLILGSTHLNVGQFPIFDDPKTRFAYTRVSLENNLQAVQSGYFDVLTHLDKYKSDFLRIDRFSDLPDPYIMEEHLPLIEEILDAMGEKDVRLEINPGLAFGLGDVELTYPQQEILQLAMDKNIRFTYGSDAHKPEHVGRLLDDLRALPVYGKAISQWEAEI